MGGDVGDLDNNGTWDIYITDLFNRDGGNVDADPRGNVLYLGNGNGTFQANSAPQAGVDSAFSWGVNFMDVDQDGFEDICVSTSTPALYQNNRNGTFTELGVFPRTARNTKDSAMTDYDLDGDLDVAAINAGSGGWIAVAPCNIPEEINNAAGSSDQSLLIDASLLFSTYFMWVNKMI